MWVSVGPLALERHEFRGNCKRLQRLPYSRVMVAGGHHHDNSVGLDKGTKTSSSLNHTEVDTRATNHQHLPALGIDTGSGCGLTLDQPRSRYQQRDGMQLDQARQLRIGDDLAAQPTRPYKATDRVRISVGNSVGSDHFNHLRQSRLLIAIDAERSRRELVVGANPDIDFALLTSEADPCYLKAIQVTDPNPVVGDDCEIESGQDCRALRAIRRCGDFGALWV